MTKKLSLQDIFNAAWNRFIVEVKPPGQFGTKACEYITTDGDMCAVGCALPESLLNKIKEDNLNDQPFYKIVSKYPSYFEDSVQEIRDVDLEGFQFNLHDGLIGYIGNPHPETIAVVKAKYLEVAKAFNLTVPGENDD